MKGLTPEEMDYRVGSYFDEKVSDIINPAPEDETIDAELNAEGVALDGDPPHKEMIDLATELPPLEIKNVEALKSSVEKFKAFHQKQKELEEIRHLLKPKTFAQVTPQLLEQLAIETKELIPEATDEDIEEIQRSFEENYQQNNSAIAFYHAIGEYWNDENALTKTENRVDNGFGQYVNSGATAALAAITGSAFGERFEAEKLISKTSIETASLIAAFKLRDKYKNNLSFYNSAIAKLSKYNAENQTKTESVALDRHKALKERYKIIQSEKAKGTLTSDAFLLEAQTNSLIEQKKNLGTALGSMQASAAFLESLIVARDAKDHAITIDFGADRKGAEMRMDELNLGEKAEIDDSDSKHIKIRTSVRALQRFESAQEVLAEQYDKNEEIKNNLNDTETDLEGNNYVKEGTYSVPFWRDSIEVNGEQKKHYFRVEQRNDIEWLKNQDKVLKGKGGGVISHPTGTGKTNAALGFFASKIDDNPDYSALVVVPKGRVRQWIDEANKFTTLGNKIVEIPENLNKEQRKNILYGLMPGQIAVISHKDAVTSYYHIDTLQQEKNLFRGMCIDEPQELASKSVKGNMSASVRKLTKLDVDNRIAMTATPARDNLIEAYDLVNWASHHDKSLGPRTRFQRIYGGYGSGTNAQDAALQQMIFKEISPHVSGNRLTNLTFTVNHEAVNINKTPIQDNNMRDIEKNADKYIKDYKEKYIKSIRENPEELAKWEKRKGRNWISEAAKKATSKAKVELMNQHWNNLEGIHGTMMKWKDNPKISETANYIANNQKEKQVIFIDNNTQRAALTEALKEQGFKEGVEIINIASTATSGGIPGGDMSKRVKSFQQDNKSRVIFIDKQSASGYNLQAGNTLHVIGTPSDAANYLQMQGRLARMPRIGDVKVRTYRYSDAPFEDNKWDKIDVQLKMLKATAPSMFFEGKKNE